MPARKKQFIRLGWELLRLKYHYYQENAGLISDAAYDQMEREYEALAKELGEEPTATNMVDFKEERPSCQLVMSRESRTPKQRKALIKRLYPSGCPCSTCQSQDTLPGTE